MSFGGRGRGPFDFDPSRMPRIQVPNFSSRAILGILGAILSIVVLWNTVYQNQPDEAGVVLRFGRFAQVTEPGLHFLVPFVRPSPRFPSSAS